MSFAICAKTTLIALSINWFNAKGDTYSNDVLMAHIELRKYPEILIFGKRSAKEIEFKISNFCFGSSTFMGVVQETQIMVMAFQTPPPILLTMGDYHGTLAAARCLGNNQVPVFLADNNNCSLTSTSQHVGRVFRTTDPVRHKTFAQNLLEIGKSNPGMVLYATSDDIAWMMAKKQG